MAKLKTVYVCSGCGAKFSKWQGRCDQCGEWQTLVEEVEERSTQSKQGKQSMRGGGVGKVVKLSEVEVAKGGEKRIKTGSGELDRVLGGGIVPGSVVLVGGEPGIGKSTLLTQLALQVSQEKIQVTSNKQQVSKKSQKTKKNSQPSKNDNLKVLYVCGEESVEQVGMRVGRLGKFGSMQSKQSKQGKQSNRGEGMSLMAEMDVDVVTATAEKEMPDLMIVDSIQTLYTRDLSGMAGSVGQVRESAFRLIELAKKKGIAVFLVGHVTKEGAIAGPKVLEHMVDAVLQLEGERTGQWRLLRSIKNRFGPTDETGVFSMQEGGMMDVTNPSGAFLEESQAGKPGSVVVAVMEGTRPVLIEIQALAVRSELAMPRRVVHGMPLSKLQVLCAVLQKSCRLSLGSMDVFVNVAGGLKVNEPAADLGIALAIASSVKNKSLPNQSVVVGEVGLLGEVRRVSFLARRAEEAKKLGYKKVIGPDKYSSVSQAVGKLLK